MIQFQKVTKIYSNGVTALKEVSVQIEKGEFVFLVGPSGAGKTTFMKMIIRRELPNEGCLIVGRKDLCHMKEKEVPIFRRNIGTIFQDYKLLPNKTVFENVAFALEVIRGFTAGHRQACAGCLRLGGLAGESNGIPLGTLRW